MWHLNMIVKKLFKYFNQIFFLIVFLEYLKPVFIKLTFLLIYDLASLLKLKLAFKKRVLFWNSKGFSMDLRFDFL